MVAVMIILGVSLTMWAVYEMIHRLFPSWGTVSVNVLTGLAMLADYAAFLPWGTVLDAKQAALVGFAIAAANGVIRLRGRGKAPVGGAP